MAYEGELLTYCPSNIFDFSRTYAVVVSGARLNPYGHMLLNTGGQLGVFFHVSELYGKPRMMDAAQFSRYLRENNKMVVFVLRVDIPDPRKSEAKLEQSLSQNFLWGAVVHNCETLVEDIVVAGGGPKLHDGWLLLPMKAGNACSAW